MIDDNKGWKGYSFEELRYKRLLSDVKIEVARASLQQQMRQATTPRGAMGALISKVTSSMGYLDYAVIALRLGRKIYSIFKK